MKNKMNSKIYKMTQYLTVMIINDISSGYLAFTGTANAPYILKGDVLSMSPDVKVKWPK